MEICLGTVDALLPSPDVLLWEPPHERLFGSTPDSVFTETPSHRDDGSVDSHRKLYGKGVAQRHQAASQRSPSRKRQDSGIQTVR